MKKTILARVVVFSAGLLASTLTGCFSLGETQVSQTPTGSKTQAQPQQKGESQLEKFQRIFVTDSEKLVVGSDNKTTIESIEAAFQPQVISGIGEITGAKLSDPGRPYYYKIRAIYKGYDADAKRALLQDLGQKQSNAINNALGAVFGIDTDVYSTRVFDVAVPTFPTEANSIATFYLVAVHLTENEGRQIDETGVYIRFVRNIENPAFDPAKFIVANGMHYITTADAHVPTRQM